MSLAKGFVARSASLAGLCVLALGMPVFAQQQPAASLGEAWPATKNVSAAPGWYAYVIVRDGVKYIQLNDAAGAVRAVIATQNGQFLVLPMGTDAERVSTPQSPLVMADAGPAITVYRDSSVQITAATDSHGGVLWVVKQKTSTAQQAVQTKALSAPLACVPSECSQANQLIR